MKQQKKAGLPLDDVVALLFLFVIMGISLLPIGITVLLFATAWNLVFQ